MGVREGWGRVYIEMLVREIWGRMGLVGGVARFDSPSIHLIQVEIWSRFCSHIQVQINQICENISGNNPVCLFRI